MSGINVGKIAKEIIKFLPEKYKSKIRNSAPGREIIKSIEAFQAPRHLMLRDGTEWKRVEDCPKPLLDPGGAQIGKLIYVIAGFPSADSVSDVVHVFDMELRRWIKSIPIPNDLPHSHSAVATDDERYIYVAGGQLGPQCRPAFPTVYCFDTYDASWSRLPSLPQPRYAGTMRLRNGRLHFMGGADEDRWTPRSEHWSLGVSGNKAIEQHWTEEQPLPIPGMHRGSAIVDGAIYVIGGQQGDFQSIPNDAKFTCTHRTQETYLASVFRLPPDDESWQRMADLPIGVSHCDFSCLVVNKTIYVYGGQVFKHPESFALRLTNAIQAYDTAANSWKIVGHIPYHLKMPVIGHHGEQVFLSVGQRGRNTTDRPGRISAASWMTSVPTERGEPEECHLPSVRGRRVLLVSHQLKRSGAPLELLELGKAMVESNANVRLVTLDDDMNCDNLSADFMVPLVAPETALTQAREAELIVVNTSHQSTADWVATSLELFPELADRMIWLIHEIDVEEYVQSAPVLKKAKIALFDSSACLAAWDEIGGLPDIAKVVFPGLPAEVFDGAMKPRQLFAKVAQWRMAEPAKLLSRQEIRSALGIRENDIVVLSIGSVTARKGQKMLLDSILKTATERKLPLKLILAGFISEEQKAFFLKGLDAADRKIFNSKLAYLTTPYIDALFLASDIHVLNSQGEHGRGETFGRVTVHAMAYGLPVLATNAGGSIEIFEDGVHGYHYPVGEAGQSDLMDRIEELARAPELRQRMGKAAAVHARAHFSKERYLNDMNGVLEGFFVKPEVI